MYSGWCFCLLNKAQYDILNGSWRISAATRLTAYRDKNYFPVHEKSEQFQRVPSVVDIVEHFLIKHHSGKATFKRSRSLFTAHLKEMGIIISLYEQHTLASLLKELGEENPLVWMPRLDLLGTFFAMSSKVLDQL